MDEEAYDNKCRFEEEDEPKLKLDLEDFNSGGFPWENEDENE